MSKDISVANTTREERMRIVAEALAFCGDSSCETCSGCSMGVGSIEAYYQPYIDGQMELRELNMARAATSYVHG